MDDCVGRILKALSDSGQADNTVVVYVSDHGDMMGDQGFWTKQVMYEASAGVPMIAAGPGIPTGRRVTTCTNLTDIAATARDVCSVEDDDGNANQPGASLVGLANAPARLVEPVSKRMPGFVSGDPCWTTFAKTTGRLGQYTTSIAR